MRILVVDDEPFIRMTVAMLLRLEGHEVSVAADGLEGLRAASDARPDVILTDLYMPGLDGRQLLAAVRADPALAHTHVVLLTGDTEAPPVDVEPGAVPDGLLTKPFQRDQLLSILNALTQ